MIPTGRRRVSGAWRTRLLDERQLARPGDRFELGMNAQLASQASDVCAHSRVADAEPVCDFAARDAFRHEPEHLLLTPCETLQLCVRLATAVEQLRDRP